MIIPLGLSENQMHKTVLLLGTNVGDRQENLALALRLISQKIGKVDGCSSVYETEAWGNEDQTAFLNQVSLVSTTIKPEHVMQMIFEIEAEMGRVRTEKWAPRIIDIDILFYDNEIIHQQGLDIPHPYLHERKFTLVPLAEMIPHYIHPELGKSIGQLLREVNDPLEVRNLR